MKKARKEPYELPKKVLVARGRLVSSGMATQPARPRRTAWRKNRVAAAILAPALAVGSFIATRARNSVPIEMHRPPAAHEKVRGAPAGERPVEPPTATPTPPPVELDHETRTRLARAATLEVPDAPEDVRKAVMKSVFTRRHEPGWFGKHPLEILSPRVYKGLALPDQDRRINDAADVFEENIRLVDEVAKEPVGPNDPTHFFTPLTYRTRNGKLVRDKDGKLVPVELERPWWAKKGKLVGAASWKSKYGTPKKIEFYRLES